MTKTKSYGKLFLLLCAAAALLLSLWLEREQGALAADVLRLHVLANSDSEEDQALKLVVRDAVLEEANALLADVTDRAEAERILSDRLYDLALAGAETVAEEGYDYSVTVRLEETWFPTREYADFALPAGDYTALRVIIGEGGGKNWWCVVFPPLCLGAVSERVEDTAALGGLSGDNIALITGEDGGYVVKFKLLELWDGLKNRLS